MSEKREPASAHKLNEARKRGDVAVSRDVAALASLTGCLLVFWLGGDFLVARLHALVDTALRAAAVVHDPQQRMVLPSQMLRPGLELIALPLVCIAGSAVLAGLLQTRGLLSFKRVAPDFSRMNPAEALKQLFSTHQFFELFKVVLKVSLISVALYALVTPSLDSVLKLVYASAQDTQAFVGPLLLRFVGWVVMLYAVSAAIDYAHQRFEFLKRHRMSVDEQQREHRDDEGDPQVEGRRIALAREWASSAPLARANVLVVNPEHVAVALHYRAGEHMLPTVIAKALDDTALAMRREADRLGVPIFEDRPLARRLYARVSVSQVISEDLYEQVADVLHWASVVRKLPLPNGLPVLTPVSAASKPRLLNLPLRKPRV